jgi:hypothetical protein
MKNRRRSHTLKGSHSMRDGRIFQKTRRDVSFNKVLWNEPTFGRIHLAGLCGSPGTNPTKRIGLALMPECRFRIDTDD